MLVLFVGMNLCRYSLFAVSQFKVKQLHILFLKKNKWMLVEAEHSYCTSPKWRRKKHRKSSEWEKNMTSIAFHLQLVRALRGQDRGQGQLCGVSHQVEGRRTTWWPCGSQHTDHGQQWPRWDETSDGSVCQVSKDIFLKLECSWLNVHGNTSITSCSRFLYTEICFRFACV